MIEILKISRGERVRADSRFRNLNSNIFLENKVFFFFFLENVENKVKYVKITY